MDMKAIKRFEYEEQLFGFSSQFFAESFKDFLTTELTSTIDNLVDSYKNKLLPEAKNPEEFTTRVDVMREKLKAEYMKSLNSEYGDIKAKISKFMEIPEHVLLKEDLLVKEGLPTEISDIDREITLLTCKYKAMLNLKKKLEKEMDTANNTIFTLNNIVEQGQISFDVMDTDEILSHRKENLALVKNNK